MKRLFGWLVFLAVAVLGIGYVFNHWPTGEKFGCQASGAVAHADSSDCPANISVADGDAAWAVARIATIPRHGDTTVGLFYDSDGHETRYTSQQDSDSETALRVGRQAGVFPSKGRPFVVDHVEVKASSAMRDGDVSAGVLVINFSGPPCGERPDGTPQPLSCSAVVPKLLPADATLVVWWQVPGGRPESTSFTGGTS